MVTEGATTNAYIVRGDRLITHPADNSILNGVTRVALLKIATDIDLVPVERPFSLIEAKAADEAFLSSTSAFLVPVVRIDQAIIGDGKPEKNSLRLLDRYRGHLWGCDA
jgi:D-alanine transaminase